MKQLPHCKPVLCAVLTLPADLLDLSACMHHLQKTDCRRCVINMTGRQNTGSMAPRSYLCCREARHPFLDEDYIQTVLSLPLWFIANLAEAPGQGDKKLLRAALSRLGLPRAAGRVKRAIQFGTGIGKLSNVRSFGSNRAANSKNAGSLSLSSLPHA